MDLNTPHNERNLFHSERLSIRVQLKNHLLYHKKYFLKTDKNIINKKISRLIKK